MKAITIDHLFQTQYKPYANYDNERSLPHLIDGLKITQRKVIYTCLLKNITNEIKVAQLASSVAFETEYHHGEQGIGGVICNLAQNFVGSNNINWLEPIGQFGSRLSPVPAAHRYIFTRLSPNFRHFFKKDDDIILNYLYEDDTRIEPDYFIPILPGVLLNSSQGIGTGFSSNILARDPDILTDYIKSYINKDGKTYQLLPFFNNFKGQVKHVEGTKYQITGCIQYVSQTQIKITELPPGMYLDDIKKQLNKLSESDIIKDYDDNSTEEYFDIDVYFQKSQLSKYSDEELIDKLKLTTTITENLTCWLPTGKLRKFVSVEEIIEYFVDWRLTKYTDRISRLIEIVTKDIEVAEEKIRFINFYITNVDTFKNSNKEKLLKLLDKNNFDHKLLELRIWSLTGDKIKELNADIKSLKAQKKTLEKTTCVDMYVTELDQI